MLFIWRGGRFQSSAKASGNQPVCGRSFLADIVCPAATALPDTTAEDQHIDHPAVVHVHVIPVVNTCAEDNHRAPMRFMGGIGKFTGDGFNILARHAGNLLTPAGVYGLISA